MNNSTVVYTLVFALFFAVVGFVCFLVAAFLIAKNNKELDAMTQRIKQRNHLNGKSTNHKIDLDQFNNGGWTGEVSGKEHIDLKLNEPHPYYAREADDE